MDRSEIKKILIGGLFALLTTVVSISLSKGEYNKGISVVVFLTTIIIFIIIWPEDLYKETVWYKNKALLLLFILILSEITVGIFLLFPHREEARIEIHPFERSTGSMSPISGIKISVIKESIGKWIEPDNYRVRKTAILAAEHSGFHTIDQFCSIFNYLLNGNRNTDIKSYSINSEQNIIFTS